MGQIISFPSATRSSSAFLRLCVRFCTPQWLGGLLLLVALAASYMVYRHRDHVHLDREAERAVWPVELDLRTGAGEMNQIHEEDLRKLIVNYPKTKAAARARIYLATLAHMPRGEYQQALALLQQVKIHVLQSEVARYIGDVYMEMQMYDKAIAEYERALRLENTPDFKRQVWMRIAFAYQLSNRLQQAIAMYDRVIAKHALDDPLHMEARKLKAFLVAVLAE